MQWQALPLLSTTSSSCPLFESNGGICHALSCFSICRWDVKMGRQVLRETQEEILGSCFLLCVHMCGEELSHGVGERLRVSEFNTLHCLLKAIAAKTMQVFDCSIWYQKCHPLSTAILMLIIPRGNPWFQTKKTENVAQLEPKTRRQKKNFANSSVSLKAQHEVPKFPTPPQKKKQVLKQEWIFVCYRCQK